MYTVYVLTSVLELIERSANPDELRIGGKCRSVKNGCTDDDGAVLESTHPEAARLKSIANSKALVEAYVGVMVG